MNNIIENNENVHNITPIPDTKDAIYSILNKMYEDKDYIDCAYEDIKALLTSQTERHLAIIEQVIQDERYSGAPRAMSIAQSLIREQ